MEAFPLIASRIACMHPAFPLSYFNLPCINVTAVTPVGSMTNTDVNSNSYGATRYLDWSIPRAETAQETPECETSLWRESKFAIWIRRCYIRAPRKCDTRALSKARVLAVRKWRKQVRDFEIRNAPAWLSRRDEGGV